MKLRKVWYTLILAGIVSFSCNKPAYEKLENGILLKLKPTAENRVRLIQVEFISDKIVHIQASPADSFSTDKSLMVTDRDHTKVPFELKEEGDNLLLISESLKVQISKMTGKIQYQDKDGKTVLDETGNGGKTFSPMVVDDKNYYSIQRWLDVSNPDHGIPLVSLDARVDPVLLGLQMYRKSVSKETGAGIGERKRTWERTGLSQ